MNTDRHIASAFDRDLESVQAMIMRMGGLVEEAILDSADALESRDAEKALRIRQGDRAIDALEEQIQTECARVLAQRAPIAGDLRTVLSVMRIAGNLERCGDYAKNLAKRSLVLNQMPLIDGSAGAIRRMAQTVQVQLRDALNAYIRRDIVLAGQVRERDADVDQMYNALFREFLTHMMEDPRNITACMHLHFIAKNIERVGDHSTAIAEQVIYLVSGALPDLARPKVETTSQDIGQDIGASE